MAGVPQGFALQELKTPEAAPELSLVWVWGVTLLPAFSEGGQHLKNWSEDMWAARLVNRRGPNIQTGKYFIVIIQEERNLKKETKGQWFGESELVLI